MSSWGWGPHDGLSALVGRDTRSCLLTHVHSLALSPHHRRTPREGARQEESSLWELNRPVLWSWTSHPPEREKIHLPCLNCSVYGILLWQPRQIKTVYVNFETSSIQQIGSWIYNYIILEFREELSPELLMWKSSSLTDGT